MEALAGATLLLGTPVCYYTVYSLSKLLPVPAVMTEAASLAYVLKRVLPPAFLGQWLAFETFAIARIPSNQQPYDKCPEKAGSPPTKLQVIERIMYNSFEQTVMMVGTCSSLALWLDSSTVFDARLPVALGWTFVAGRVLFALGYLKHPMLRLQGLFLGGFWANCAALLYCTLRVSGLADSRALIGGCAALVPLATAATAITIINASKKNKKK